EERVRRVRDLVAGEDHAQAAVRIAHAARARALGATARALKELGVDGTRGEPRGMSVVAHAPVIGWGGERCSSERGAPAGCAAGARRTSDGRPGGEAPRRAGRVTLLGRLLDLLFAAERSGDQLLALHGGVPHELDVLLVRRLRPGE